MKYIVTAKTGRVLARRVYVSDPAQNAALRLPAGHTVHEVSDEDGTTYQATLEQMERGQHATFDGTTLSVVEVVEAISHLPFKKQLQVLLGDVQPRRRRKLVEAIGPGFALDDVDAMAASLDALDVSGRSARIQKLKADVLTALGRESAKRANL